MHIKTFKGVTTAVLLVTNITFFNAHTGETLDTRIGKLSFTHDYAYGIPLAESQERLLDEFAGTHGFIQYGQPAKLAAFYEFHTEIF